MKSNLFGVNVGIFFALIVLVFAQTAMAQESAQESETTMCGGDSYLLTNRAMNPARFFTLNFW